MIKLPQTSKAIGTYKVKGSFLFVLTFLMYLIERC